MRKRAIYPGTFDPITNGHIDIISRARRLFDEIVVAIAASVEKNPMFSLECRVAMARRALEGIEGVEVVPFRTLLVEFALEQDSFIILRGLRAVSDFEYELQMGYTNSSLNPDIETVHLMPSLENAFISSTVVRAILRHGGAVSHLVHPAVAHMIRERACM